MGLGPITIFDKSALQALSMDGSVWFDAFFLANLVPLFYVETLADLEKKVAKGRDPEQLVGHLARCMPPFVGLAIRRVRRRRYWIDGVHALPMSCVRRQPQLAGRASQPT